jgi:hypothetical protein
MSDSRYKSETKIKGDRKPRANYCGDCGEECDGLLCDECSYSVSLAEAWPRKKER